MSADPTPRFTLRHLPLPAKLVLTLFLLTVGLGYSSAMVQLHMQHSDRDGTTLPTPANVAAVFAGKVWKAEKNDDDPRVVSRLEAIISGEPHGSLTAKNMTPAFFENDDRDYKDQVKADPSTEARRHGERLAVITWINTAPEARRKAYTNDGFALPREQAKQPITAGFVKNDELGASLIKIKTIIDLRCARCHVADGEKGDIPFSTYEEIEKYMPVEQEVPAGGGWVNSGRQMSLEKLTQSTHAHLLSFAVLFALTGLIFAFSGYPGVVRGVVGPVVLLAQTADVACWWLARLPDGGPYFAMAIIGTGGVVGLGLGAQIVLSLFNMYGPKGKVVLLLLFAVAGGVGGAGYTKVVKPYLDAERVKVAELKGAEKKKAAEEKEKQKAAKKADPKESKPPVAPDPVAKELSPLERALTGPFDKDGPWAKDGKVPPGGMVRALFDKDAEYKDAMKAKSPDLPRLTAEREGEQAALLAWAAARPDERKKAYEADKFPLPPGWAKPVTAEFQADAKAVKIKAIFESRCVTCHTADNKVPLETFEQIERHLKPTK